METAQERERRISRLEAERQQRRADVQQGGGLGVWPTPDDGGMGVSPLQVGPGRGNLNFTSGFVPTFPTSLALLGRTVSFARLFMSQPWVAAAVMRMMTWGIRVPLKCYRKVGEDTADRVRLKSEEHPLAEAIYNPYNRANQAQLIQAMIGAVMVHGNSVFDVQSGASDKITITPMDWRFTRPIMPFRDTIDGFTFNVDTTLYRIDRSVDSVLHVAWWSPIGPIGTSPLQQLGITLQIEDAAQRYQRAQFNNGARPPSALVASDAFLGLEPKERQQVLAQLREDLRDIYSGPENAGKPALLPPGLDWKQTGHTSVEAELIDQRKITREEIAAVYQIPPPLMGILDRATYSNIEVQRNMTYTDCLGPPLVLCEQAINAQIARDLLREPDIFVEFDFGAVLRGDRLKEIDALRDGIATALMTPNEGRGILNLKKSDDPAMDEFYMPTNNLGQIGTTPSSRPGPGGTPVPDGGSPDGPNFDPNELPDTNRGHASGQRPLWVPSSARDRSTEAVR